MPSLLKKIIPIILLVLSNHYLLGWITTKLGIDFIYQFLINLFMSASTSALCSYIYFKARKFFTSPGIIPTEESQIVFHKQEESIFYNLINKIQINLNEILLSNDRLASKYPAIKASSSNDISEEEKIKQAVLQLKYTINHLLTLTNKNYACISQTPSIPKLSLDSEYNNTSQLNILIISDTYNFKIHLQNILINKGYIVTIANGGYQALNLLQESKKSRCKWQLVFLDQGIESVDGIFILQEIRKLFNSIQLPIISCIPPINNTPDYIKRLHVNGTNLVILNNRFQSEYIEKVLQSIYKLLAEQKDNPFMSNQPSPFALSMSQKLVGPVKLLYKYHNSNLYKISPSLDEDLARTLAPPDLANTL